MAVHREQIEELLELCWTASEDGLMPLNRHKLPTQLICFLPHPIEPNGDTQQHALEAMVEQGLLRLDQAHLSFTPSGSEQAQAIARRHRLTEVLLHNVLEVSDASVESIACQVEHILNAEVTEAVCAFLGHPPSCPHGRAIPRGTCCEDATVAQPLIAPLAELSLGEEATVAFIHTPRHEYLKRLTTFGIAPGRSVRLRQLRPAVVIDVGHTQLALDQEAGREIFVRRQQRHA